MEHPLSNRIGRGEMTFDVCIVGQGLAGTTLAWALRFRGQRVAVVDAGEPATASRIAAGLITPVTGLRFVKSWRFETFFPAAKNFYRRVEAATDKTLFDERPMMRLFASAEERELVGQKARTAFPNLVASMRPTTEESLWQAPWGGCEFHPAARLNVKHYLQVSRERFTQREACFQHRLDPANDLTFEPQAVRIPRLGIAARRVVFCQGFATKQNPWFRNVPFDAAKGETLTIRVPGLTERQTVHRDVWLAPEQDGLFRLGATYDRDRLDAVPTPAGREQLCRRLQAFLRLPFEVLKHQAAVRPILLGRRAAVGLHPTVPQLGYFNGLGSKGALQAPWLADRFAEFLTEGTPLESTFDVSHRADLSACRV